MLIAQLCSKFSWLYSNSTKPTAAYASWEVSAGASVHQEAVDQAEKAIKLRYGLMSKLQMRQALDRASKRVEGQYKSYQAKS